MKTVRSYHDLKRLRTFEDRFNYLRLFDRVATSTFGSKRFLNQALYASNKWKKVRGEIIIRDNGCDLGVDEYEIFGAIYIHHINPITIDDIRYERNCVFDLDNLISSSLDTHNRIHFGSIPPKTLIVRKPNDTCPWKEVI